MQEQGILFDLDGTLADTAPDLVGALNHVLLAAGRDPVPLETARWWVAGGSVRLIAEGFRISPAEAKASPERQQLLNVYGAHICEHTRLFPGIAELLEWLESQAIPWGVVTNKPGRYTDPLLRELQLQSRASAIVSGDTLAVSKPDPAPLLLASGKIQRAAAQCVYVGDDHRDVVAGRGAGMTTVAVDWGYGRPEEIPAWRADVEVSKPSEILRFVESRLGG
mgnify:CR=1 FL=1